MIAERHGLFFSVHLSPHNTLSWPHNECAYVCRQACRLFWQLRAPLQYCEVLLGNLSQPLLHEGCMAY